MITYATFDRNNKTAATDIELSGLVVVNQTSSALAQSRSTIALSEGKWAIEALFWGDGDLDTNSRIGISGPTGAGALSSVVGTSLDSYGYRPDTGQVFRGGSVIASLSPSVKGDVIGLALDLDASPASLEFFVNGAMIGSVQVQHNGPFHVLGAVFETDAFSLRLFVNFGQRALEHAPETGFNEGWYTETATPATLRFATASFTTAHDDVMLPDTHYSGRLEPSQQFQVAREAIVWPWGPSESSRGSFGELAILRAGGEFDGLILEDYRDQPFRIRVIEEGLPYATAETVATGVFDAVVRSDDTRIVVAIRDKLAQLSVPLTRRLFLPNVAASAANRSWPVTIGTARNVDPVLYDEALRAYAVNDGPVASIAVVRDKADPLDPLGSPTDWEYNGDSSGFMLHNDPQGKVVADVSTTGGEIIVPVDILNGFGSPFVYSGADLLGWGETEGTFSGQPYGNQAGAISGSVQLFAGSAGFGPNPVGWTGVAPSPRVGGRRERRRVDVSGFSYHAGSRGMNLRVGQSSGSASIITIIAPGQYVVTFTAVSSGDLFLTGVKLVSGGDANPRYVQITSITVEDINAQAVADLEAVIPGATLETFAREVIEERAGLTSDDWDSDSAAETDLGLYDCGIFTHDAATCRQALDAIMPAYCGSYWQDRLGKIRFGRLVDPENPPGSPTVDVDWTFTAGDLIEPPVCQIDTARGLSSSISVRRNWTIHGDSDFVDDTIDVPLVVRERFRRAYQITLASASSLAVTYRHALVAAPIETPIDDPDDGQDEIDFVNGLYEPTRLFAALRVKFTDAQEFKAEPFQRVFCTYPDPIFENGRYLLIRRVEVDPIAENVTITGWL